MLETLTRTEVTRPALRYFGGKWRLAPWIIEQFEPHQVYTEVFGGAYSVGLRKRRGTREVYSDRCGRAVNFFRVLQRQPETLILALADPPLTAEGFERCCRDGVSSELELARRYYWACWLSFTGGGGRWSGGVSPERLACPPDPAHLWAAAVRLQGVEILQQDAISVLRQHDSPTTLHYVDPPYLHSARGSHDRRRESQTPRRQYQHEMSDRQHQQLATTLKQLQGQVVLSGYPSELYSELYSGWRQVSRTTQTASGGERVEMLWIKPGASLPPQACSYLSPPEQVNSQGLTPTPSYQQTDLFNNTAFQAKGSPENAVPELSSRTCSGGDSDGHLPPRAYGTTSPRTETISGAESACPGSATARCSGGRSDGRNSVKLSVLVSPRTGTVFRRRPPKGHASGWIEQRFGNRDRASPSVSHYYYWDSPMGRVSVYVRAAQVKGVQSMVSEGVPALTILRLVCRGKRVKGVVKQLLAEGERTTIKKGLGE